MVATNRFLALIAFGIPSIFFITSEKSEICMVQSSTHVFGLILESAGRFDFLASINFIEYRVFLDD